MVKGVWQWEELKHAVLVLCNKFQGDPDYTRDVAMNFNLGDDVITMFADSAV